MQGSSVTIEDYLGLHDLMKHEDELNFTLITTIA